MKKCSNLQCALGAYGGGLFADEDDYCSECGNKLVPKEEVNCQCGHRLGHNDKFCSGCGLPREEAVRPKEVNTVKVATSSGTVVEFEASQAVDSIEVKTSSGAVIEIETSKEEDVTELSLVCVHCGHSFENHDFPCPGCGQDPRR